MKHLIWLASYPKSGNTWLRILLDSILFHAGEPVDINHVKTASLRILERHNFEEFLEFDSGELTIEETNAFKRKYYLDYGQKRTEDTFVKTHEANVPVNGRECIIPEEVTKLSIYIVRNPLDIVASLSNHYLVDINKAISIMGDSTYTFFRHAKGITSNIPEFIGDWSMHVKSWLNSKELPLLVVRYEDLLNNSIQTLRKITDALDYSVSDAVLARAVDNHSFQKLKGQESTHGFRERVAGTESFFRKGKSGSWKEELTQGQIRQVIQDHKEVMDNLGYNI